MKKQKGKSAAFHPSGESADTDLIRLTREFESLKRELESLVTSDAECTDAINAAQIEFNMILKRRQSMMDHNNRRRRMTSVQMDNIRELIFPLVQSGLNLATGIDRCFPPLR